MDRAATFELTESSRIRTGEGATGAAEYLAEPLRPSTGCPVPVTRGKAAAGDIAVLLDGDSDLDAEGYRLTVIVPSPGS